MTTVRATVFRHHEKADGTYNVKICIYHKRKRIYINTAHFITRKQLTKHFEIKDDFILNRVNQTLDKYRREISEISEILDGHTVESLKDYLLGKGKKVDFLEFCQIHLDQLEKNGRSKSKSNYKTVCNSIQDYLGNRDKLPIEEITLSWIAEYENFLRSKRTMVRKGRDSKNYTLTGKPLTDSTVHIYLRDFRGIFSAAMAYYNKPSLGIEPIRYNPFKEYTIVEPPETKKRALSIQELITFRDCQTRSCSRAELAQKLGMLSFYLCGMNAVDLHNRQYVVRDGRIEYSRSKTMGKRKDRAFISIKIPPEAKPLLQYAANRTKRYANIVNLNKAICRGMADLSALTKIPKLQFYSFRHSFGNLARNACRKSKDDVALALNHIDQARKTTDIYLAKEWIIIDEVQEAVLNLIRSESVVRYLDVG